MMKRNYKIYILSLLLPFIASAQAVSPKDANFCDQLSVTKTDIEKKLDHSIASAYQKRTAISDTIIKARTARDNQKTINRLRWDSIYDNSVTKLRTKANTAVQKTAVEKYIATIVDIVNTRRTATNASIQAFREGITNALHARNDALDVAISHFKQSINSAFDKAQVECNQNSKPSLVRQNFKDALKTARENFVKERIAAESLADSIAPLRESRKTTMASILTNFKTALEKARIELKKILP